MELRDYQKKISKECYIKLLEHKICYIAAQVRTGKTLMALEAAKLYEAKNVLFLTKKKAISSIQNDYNAMGYSYNLTVINDEQLHTLTNDYDLIIHDEHHRFSAFPKPGKAVKLFKELFHNKPMIFLSGTVTPESYSQIFHQFWVSDFSPFKEFTNFYKWSKKFVKVTQRNLGYGLINDYSKANNELIKPIIEPFTITFTQEQAGFTSVIKEHVLKVKLGISTYDIAERLKKDLVVEGKGDCIIADTAVKLMQKLHQIYSGTVILESGNISILDRSKINFIAQYFYSKKIAIFYKFKAELQVIKELGDRITTDIDEFNNTDKWLAIQIVSGREGLNLSKADALVYYNIDFSAVSYWQSRDRMTTKDRLNNEVFWIFSENGIEEEIYKKVMKKKNFTLSTFKKTYGFPNKNN